MNDDIKGTWKEVFQRNAQAEKLFEEWKQLEISEGEFNSERKLAIENELYDLGFLIGWNGTGWTLASTTPMLGTYQQHHNLLQLLSQTTGHEELVRDYQQWIIQGNELAWSQDQREWEEQGYTLLARIGGIFGPSTVQTMLLAQEGQ